MYREDFAARLTDLRNARGVSAREMSLSIGQNPGYIHNIECGRALPSMECFFFICEYLKITPADFLTSATRLRPRLPHSRKRRAGSPPSNCTT